MLRNASQRIKLHRMPVVVLLEARNGAVSVCLELGNKTL